MKIYFAPLESISSYPLRNTHSRFFPGIDKYFTPFISANEEGHYSGVIAYTMMKNRPHWKVFLLHYLFLHIQMLLLFVFLAFFTGNL